MILERPSIILRIEGAAVFAACAYIYSAHGWSLLMFVVLFLAVDLCMLGYVAGQRAGAMIYNLFHQYLFPILLGVYALVTATDLALQIALIWMAHIGADRVLGYGLKTPNGFKTTHVQLLSDAEASGD